MSERLNAEIVAYLPFIRKILAAKRHSIGLTQDDLNEQLGYADRLVSKWECGLKRPSALMLLRWIKSLSLCLQLDYDVLDRYQVKAILTGHNEPKQKRYPTPELLAFLKEHNAKLIPCEISQ